MTTRIVTFHAATLAVSEYSLPWIDVVQVDGEIYGLGPDGVQTLSGPIEAGATPYVETGEMALAGGALCGLSRADLVMRADGQVALTAAAVQGAERVPPPYPVRVRPGDGERQRSVKLARGPRGQAWRLRLASTGGEWTLSGLQVQAERVGRVR